MKWLYMATLMAVIGSGQFAQADDTTSFDQALTEAQVALSKGNMGKVKKAYAQMRVTHNTMDCWEYERLFDIAVALDTFPQNLNEEYVRVTYVLSMPMNHFEWRARVPVSALPASWAHPDRSCWFLPNWTSSHSPIVP